MRQSAALLRDGRCVGSHDETIFTDEADRRHDINESLGWGNDWTAEVIEDILQEMLTETHDTTDTEVVFTETNSLLKQHVTFSTNDAAEEQKFSPNVGSTEGSAALPVTTAPVLTDSTLAFRYPASAVVTTFTLKNPEADSTESEWRAVEVTTRGGETSAFADTWGTARTLELQITNVCDPTIDQFVAFLNATLGMEIFLDDWHGRTWRGVIVAPETSISEDSGGFSASIQFRGELE